LNSPGSPTFFRHDQEQEHRYQRQLNQSIFLVAPEGTREEKP
jgi:hypothetical protein